MRPIGSASDGRFWSSARSWEWYDALRGCAGEGPRRDEEPPRADPERFRYGRVDYLHDEQRSRCAEGGRGGARLRGEPGPDGTLASRRGGGRASRSGG